MDGTYPLVLDVRLLDLEPARTHNFPLHDKKLESASVRPKYPREVGALDVVLNLRFYSPVLERTFACSKTSQTYH